MKNIYILILFFLISIQTLHSQYSASSVYFPLQVGNSWIYTRFQSPGEVYSVLHVKITKDTVINNERYYYLHHFPEQSDYWMHYDTSNGILYRFEENNSPFIRLSANAGDTMFYICSGIKDTILFDVPSKIKSYYYHLSVPHTSSGTEIELAENFGQTYYFEYYSSYTQSHYLYAWLKGCIIDGIIYGDTSLTIGNNHTPEQIPENFSLKQNFPNPFNPETKIKFELMQNCFTSLKIYDITGREVSTLVNMYLNAGEYTFKWNASNIQSGVYFYQLKAGEFTETKKMVLTK